MAQGSLYLAFITRFIIYKALSTSIDSRGVFRTLVKYLRWSVLRKCLAVLSRAVKMALKCKRDRTCRFVKTHLQHLGFVEKSNFSPLANHALPYVCPYTYTV